MAGRRFFQRGHASVPAASLTSGAEGPPRWLVLGVFAVAAGAGAAYLIGELSERFRDSLSSARPDPTQRPSTAPPPATLLDAALAKVQAATHPNRPESRSSGLAPLPLTDDGIAKVAPLLGQAEARLIAIYRLISQGQHRDALQKAEQLVADHPNFHLAHLVHGDLLSLQMRPVRQLGDVPDTTASAAAQQLATLREESRRRLSSLTERPPEGAVPSQFLALSPSSRHAIAVDASRSRLYLFENLSVSSTSERLAPQPKFRLLGDFYISVGLSGTEKSVEGDKRTPLGVYYITSNLNPSSLPDLYGVGALPINYPNPLDVQRGKTGSGIWLHGTPKEQFVRAPQASDGCVVLSNPDLEKLLDTVAIRTTPVVIAPELHWVQPGDQDGERNAFEASLAAWRDAKSQGHTERLKQFYVPQPAGGREPAAPPWPRVEAEFKAGRGARELELKDVSMLHWKDRNDTMVVTFGEVAQGQSRGALRRQYWTREDGEWKIFYEGTP